MAWGRGGIHSGRQYSALSGTGRTRYESDLEVLDLTRSGLSPSVRAAYREVYGHNPRGRDYGRMQDTMGEALRKDGGRLHVRDNDTLWRGDDSVPILTPDGVYDAVGDRMSWRQRSIAGQQWSLVGRARRLTDEELARELRPFKGQTYRVHDPETGRIVGMPMETDPGRFRSFATSPEAGQERPISPRIGRGPAGAGR